MKREREEESLMIPALEQLQARIPQKYELVLAATRRAKQIIRQQQLNAGGEDGERPGKPLTLALHDIAEGRVGVEQLSEPDIIFDDYEEEQQDFFPELERFHRDEPDGALDAVDMDEDDEDEEDLDLDEDLENGDDAPAL